MELNFYKRWSDNMKDGVPLPTCSVCEFVRKLEGILSDSHQIKAPESDLKATEAVDAPHMGKPKDPPLVNWGGAVVAVSDEIRGVGKRLFPFLLGSHEWRIEMTKMFDSAQVLILDRQKSKADGLIQSRNDELKEWKKALQSREG
jgi:hypothetical protein